MMEMNNIDPDSFTLTAIVLACSRARQWKAVDLALKNMKLKGLRPLGLRASRLTLEPGETSARAAMVLQDLTEMREE
ncbi:unnamed protein product, partial [Discosporangium mesarthrocarpum]